MTYTISLRTDPTISYRQSDGPILEAMYSHCPSENLGGPIDAHTWRLALSFIDVLRRLSLHE